MNNKSRSCLCLLVSLLVMGKIHADSRVAEIHFNGQPVDYAENIRFSEPKKPTVTQPISVGYVFPSGTTLEMPAKTQMKLHNVDAVENEIILAPFSKMKLVSSAKGERHTSLFGDILYNVKKRLSFFTVNSPRGNIQLAVKSTSFRTQVTADNIKYERLDGEVSISREVALQIAEASEAKNRSRKKELATQLVDELTGYRSNVSYSFDYYKDESKSFASYEDAIQYFGNQVTEKGEPSEELADRYTTLGQLYLENELPEQALEAFRAALQINESLSCDGFDPVIADDHTDIGYAYLALGRPNDAATHFQIALDIKADIDSWDIWVADSYLDLSDAAYDAGDENASAHYAEQAIRLLQEIAEFDVEDLNIAIEDGDVELQYLIRLDLADNFELTAFAFENLNDQINAERYFERADELYDQVDEYH